MIVTRLLLTPFVHPAPDGVREDVVRVSDGSRHIYLLPEEYEAATEELLRQRLVGHAADRSDPASAP